MPNEDDGKPVAIETQEQAAQLAAKIVHESGLSKDMVSPGSAKFLAHQILADHVIESQKQEMEKQKGEVDRLTALLAQRSGQLKPARSSWSPRNSVPSPIVPPNPNAADPPDFTDSMARPDSALLGKRAASAEKPMTEDELVHKLVALLKGGSQGGLGSRKSSRASVRRSEGDAKRMTTEIESLTGQRTTALNVPNFTELATNTIISTEGKGGDVPLFPATRQLPPLFTPTTMPTPNHEATELPVQHDSSCTTLPPPPFQNMHVIPEDIDWATVSRDVLDVVHELHQKAIEAEEQKTEMESKLNTVLASPRRYDDEVFESPVEQLGLRQGTQQYIPLAVAPPTPPLMPQGIGKPASVAGSHASSIFNAQQRLNQKNTISESPAPIEVQEYNWNMGNYGGASKQNSQAPTPVRSIPSPPHPASQEASIAGTPFLNPTPRHSAPPAPTPHQSAPHVTPHSIPANPVSHIEERRMSSATVQSVVQGTMAMPGGIPIPETKNEVAEAPVDSLPEGWKEYKTSEGRPYYYNTASGKSHWKRPTAAAGKPLMINININVDKRKKKGNSMGRDSSMAPTDVAARIEAVEATPAQEEEVPMHVETIVQESPAVVEQVPEAVPLPSMYSMQEQQDEIQQQQSVQQIQSQPSQAYAVPQSQPSAQFHHSVHSSTAPQQPLAAEPAEQPVQEEPSPHTPSARVHLANPTPDYVVDDRSGSPIIVPPLNSITTVVVEAAPGFAGNSPLAHGGGVQIRGGSMQQGSMMVTPDGNRVVNISVA
eukprot:TRINITY_DN113_c2_g1_i3.p1 TRINITY_DN113_c2_g1~~TRINITY_DN113_c2_g1_i3.p1  ORF type:complete len:769 (+),score=221.81 TRINITY_DN113_c2_g1_i3:40-2346(+)